MPTMREFVKICCAFTMFVGALVLGGLGHWNWGFVVMSIMPVVMSIVRMRKNNKGRQ